MDTDFFIQGSSQFASFTVEDSGKGVLRISWWVHMHSRFKATLTLTLKQGNSDVKTRRSNDLAVRAQINGGMDTTKSIKFDLPASLSYTFIW